MQDQTVPQSTTTEADPRRLAYELIVASVASGLPIPATIELPGHYHKVTIRLPRNDTAGVDAWVARLGLTPARLDRPLTTGIRDYGTSTQHWPVLPDWFIEVQCFCTEDGVQ